MKTHPKWFHSLQENDLGFHRLRHGVMNGDATHHKKIWENSLPNTYRQAMKAPEADQWLEAMEEQSSKLMAAGAWDLVNQNEATSLILPGKWVFDTKTDGKGVITKYRSAAQKR